jgi:hypothetical protein
MREHVQDLHLGETLVRHGLSRLLLDQQGE